VIGDVRCAGAVMVEVAGVIVAVGDVAEPFDGGGGVGAAWHPATM
jgi:hypothetical protein